VGRQCDQCQAGHFDLDTTNPKGCKACFCHGHGTTCTSAQGIKSKILLSTFETDTDDWKLEDIYGKSTSVFFYNLLRPVEVPLKTFSYTCGNLLLAFKKELKTNMCML